MAVYVSSSVSEIVNGETPSGVVDGTNIVFNTSEKFTMVFNGSQIKVFFNGIRLSFPDDYTVAESIPGDGFDTIMMSVPPRSTDHILVDYEIA